MADGIVYMAISLRNVGDGIAVLRGWRVEPATASTIPTIAAQAVNLVRPDPATFRQQGRDLYVPAGDVSFWQAAIRQPDDPFRAGVVQAIESGERVIVDILYGDHEGGQRAISRFGVMRQRRRRWHLAVLGRPGTGTSTGTTPADARRAQPRRSADQLQG